MERHKVAELDRLGFSQREIAHRLGVSQPQVCYDLRKIRERYKEAAQVEITEKIQEKLAQYRGLRVELYEAWLRSMVAFEKVVTELNPKGNVLRIIRTIRARLPSPEFMALILDTYQAERDLLGLDAPPKAPVKGQMGVSLDVNWEPPPRNPDPVLTDNVDDLLEDQVPGQLPPPTPEQQRQE
jgi:predicted transcriptional regulator